MKDGRPEAGVKEREMVMEQGVSSGWGWGNVITLSALEPRGLMTEITDTQPDLDSDTGDRQVSVTEITSVTG